MAYKTLIWPLTNPVAATLFWQAGSYTGTSACAGASARGSVPPPKYPDQLIPPSGLCSQQDFPSTIL